MKKSKNSFSVRLSLNILLFTSILFISVIAVAAISSHMLISKEAANSATYMLDSTIKDIEMYLKDIEATTRDAHWLIEEHINDPEYLYYITNKLVTENEDIVGSAIAFTRGYFPEHYFFSPYSYQDPATGEILSKQLGSTEYDYFFMDWFQIPSLLGEPVWSEPYYDDGGSNQLISTYSFPLKDENGEVYAIFTADVTLEWLSNIISDLKPYPNSYTILVSRNGSFISTTQGIGLHGETLFSTISRSNDSTIHKFGLAMMNGESGTMQFRNNRDEMSFAVFGALTNGWSTSVICPYKDVLQRSSQMYTILTILGLIGLLILFAICYFTIRKLTRPLSDFSKSVINIAKGDFNTVLPEIKSHDEIRHLRDSFEFMQNSLTTYIEDLKNTTAANQRFESELNIANAIQMNMVPRNYPKRSDIDLHAFISPAKEVGGDLYDFYIKNDILYFAVGDVSGKGVPASLFMAITRSAFRFISGLDFELHEIMERINNAISEGNENGMFVTLFIAKLDLKTGQLKYCNAGHNPLVVINPDESAYFLPVKPNIAAGVFADFEFAEQELMLEHDTRLVLYTDGVTEAEDCAKNQFGEDRLMQWCRTPKKHKGAEAGCNDLLANVKEFTNGAEQNDDITIMTIKYFKQ